VLRRMAASMRAVAIPGLDLGRGVTFSGGVVRRIGSEPFSDTISRADKAMYAAKSSGRDKIVAG
jgi:PleD family two-component response regulator